MHAELPLPWPGKVNLGHMPMDLRTSEFPQFPQMPHAIVEVGNVDLHQLPA